MSLAYLGLSIASRALFAAQQALDTVSHNIANANTPGYSRQESILQATPPIDVPILSHVQHAGQLGTGVAVVTTQRLRDSFADSQWRREALGLGSAQVTRDTLTQIEGVYNEPSDTGLQAMLSKFWAAWQDLSNDPSSAAQRSALRQQALALTQTFNHAYASLSKIDTDLNTQIQLQVQGVNGITQQIAALNTQISRVVATGNQPNDLLDQRDLLVDQLARTLPIDTSAGPNGVLNVYFQGHALVDGDHVTTLQALPNPGNGGNVDLTFDGASFLTAASGQIGGLQSTRDGVLAQQFTQLDNMAIALRDAVNAQHQQGTGLDGVSGRDFFAGTGARDLTLSAAVLASTDAIAAAGPGEGAGGAANAQAIAALQNTPITIGGSSAVLGDYYGSATASLGVATQAASNDADNQQALVDTLDRQRQAASGVSLDEETLQMIQYQRAYQAAARVITVIDETLDKLINDTGAVGR